MGDEENLNCDYFMLSVELTGETQERGLAVMSEGIRNSWLTIEQLLKGSQSWLSSGYRLSVIERKIKKKKKSLL